MKGDLRSVMAGPGPGGPAADLGAFEPTPIEVVERMLHTLYLWRIGAGAASPPVGSIESAGIGARRLSR